MKKHGTFILSIVMATAFFSSCSIGLLPSLKAREQATVSFTLSVAHDPTTGKEGRAVSSGAGTLYIRIPQEKDGTRGRALGPYALVAGKEFRTNDIPAGSYSAGIFMLVAEAPVDGLLAAMGTGDAEFQEYIDSSAFCDAVSGTASCGTTGALRVTAGEVTSVSITLVPVVGSDAKIDLSSLIPLTLKPATENARVRKFIRLDGAAKALPVGQTNTSIECDVTGTGTIRSLSLYDSAGSFVADFARDASSGSYTVPRASADPCYLYVDGNITSIGLSARAVYSGGGYSSGNFALSVASSSSFAGKKAYFSLSASLAEEVPAALGVCELDSAGAGTCAALDPASGLPISLPAGTYYLKTFIDANGNAVAKEEAPDSGDFVASALPVTVATKPSRVSLPMASFTKLYIYEKTDLSSLGVSVGTLVPPFDPTITNYTVEVGYTTTQITISATAAYPDSTLGGLIGGPLTVNTGSNAMFVSVTAVDNSKKDYFITVTRAAELTWDWKTIDTTPSQTWTGVAASDDGNTIVAISDNNGMKGLIYVSTDGGISWNQKTTPGLALWVSVCCSSDGGVMAAAATNGYIWISTDYGVSWNQTSAGQNAWTCIRMSADGSKLIASATSSGLSSSTDTGVTWSTYALSAAWSSVDCNVNGNRMYACRSDLARIYSSSDGGSNWAMLAANPPSPGSCIAMDDSGSTISLVLATKYPFVFSSSSWTSLSGFDYKNWSDVSLSSNGTFMAVSENEPGGAGKVYTIRSNGGSFLSAPVIAHDGAGLNSWKSIFMNTDGTLLIAAPYTTTGSQKLVVGRGH